ncbi:hypothetical protein J3459_017532 [Metarhizium acridum]|nr:hypothetical protein J3459_017532 [Metarhizium acridum]
MDLDTPPEAPFERLPAEILDLIILQPFLCGEDIKSIRLVSRRITSSATRCLFQQVHISALHRDREVFLSIAQSPHLACHVQTLVWDELTGKFELLQDESLRIKMGWRDPFDSAGFSLVDDLTSQVEPLFWLTSKSVKLEKGKKKATDALPFWDEFVEAVDKFPALRAFVSRPMQPDREVQSAADGYPLSVRVINGFLHFDDWVGNTGENSHHDTVFNLGFLFYLIPLLKLYTERGDQRPRQLCFSDEAVVAMSSLERLATSDAPAFRHLYHLELDVFEQAIRPSRETSGLEACLTEAVNLRHLHLKYVQAPNYGGPRLPPEADVYRSPLFAIPTLPSLLSLCLDNVILELSSSKSPESVPDLPLDHEQPAFINFVKRHAATLKRLCVVSSAVRAHSIRKLARIPNLKLHRLIIIRPFGDNNHYAFEEEDILNFINSKYDYSNLSQQAKGRPVLSFWNPLSTHEHPTWKELGRDEWLSMDMIVEKYAEHMTPRAAYGWMRMAYTMIPQLTKRWRSQGRNIVVPKAGKSKSINAGGMVDLGLWAGHLILPQCSLPQICHRQTSRHHLWRQLGQARRKRPRSTGGA